MILSNSDGILNLPHVRDRQGTDPCRHPDNSTRFCSRVLSLCYISVELHTRSGAAPAPDQDLSWYQTGLPRESVQVFKTGAFKAWSQRLLRDLG